MNFDRTQAGLYLYNALVIIFALITVGLALTNGPIGLVTGGVPLLLTLILRKLDKINRNLGG